MVLPFLNGVGEGGYGCLGDGFFAIKPFLAGGFPSGHRCDGRAGRADDSRDSTESID